MYIIKQSDCPEIINCDRTIIREIISGLSAPQLSFSLAQGFIRPGQSSLMHRLTSAEVYYILAGVGVMYIDDEQADVHPGQTIYIPSNSRQQIANTGACDLKFLCIVAPPFRAENEEILL